MSLINLQDIKKAFAGIPILDGVNLFLNKGEKVGLVGRNGCGKTTLLNIAADAMETDSGERTLAGNLSFGMLAQTPEFGDAKTVLEAASRGQLELDALEQELGRVSSAMADTSQAPEALDKLIKRHERLEERYRLLGGYSSRGRVEAVLTGIGFKEADREKHPGHLSGGEAKRLQLALVLLGGHDILFLDEPGNHLDLAGTEWLTDFLKDYKGAVLLVSHDRYLLDGVVDRIVELDEGRTFDYRGNCTWFLKERERRLEEALKKKEIQDKFISDKEEYIRRNFYGQKAKQAKSKRKMIDRLDSVHVPRAHNKVGFRFKEASLRGDHVLKFKRISARIEDTVLYENLDMDVEMGETVGIIGPNGCGKSTLLRIVLGRFENQEGEVWISPTAKPAYFDQALAELGDSDSLIDEMHRIVPKATDGELRKHLARFLFRKDEVEKNLGELSGGERNRALLAKIALEEANLLILDEPTNHLDIYTRESLEEAVKRFAGTVVLVSHDRHLLDGIVDRLLVLGESTPYIHIGNYSSYAAKVKADRAKVPRLPAAREKQGPRKKNTGQARVKRKHTYEELESLIIEKEGRLEEIGQEVYKEEVYMDGALSKKLQEEAVKLKAELNDLYKEWETWA